MNHMNPLGDNSLGKFLGLLGTSALSQVGSSLAVIPAWVGSTKEWISIIIWGVGIIGTILYAFSLYLDIEKKMREKHEAQEAKYKAIQFEIENKTCELRRSQGRCPLLTRHPVYVPEELNDNENNH